MSVLAASKVLGIHRSAVKDRMARGFIDYEVNEHGHWLPIRDSVARYKAHMEQDAAAVGAAA